MKLIPNAKPIPSPAYDDDDDLADIRAIAGDLSLVTAVTKARKRFRFSFWLDALKTDQNELCYWIADLKLKRTFAPILRDALTVYRELMRGETTMLYQLFPEQKPPPPIISPEKLKKLEEEVANLRIQVDILIKQKSNNPVDMSVKMQPIGQGMKAAPIVDDEDIELVIRKDATSGERAAQNLVNSMLALNGEQPMFKS